MYDDLWFTAADSPQPVDRRSSKEVIAWACSLAAVGIVVRKPGLIEAHGAGTALELRTEEQYRDSMRRVK